MYELQQYSISIKSTIEYNNYEFMEFCDQINLSAYLLKYTISKAKFKR